MLFSESHLDQDTLLQAAIGRLRDGTTTPSSLKTLLYAVMETTRVRDWREDFPLSLLHDSLPRSRSLVEACLGHWSVAHPLLHQIAASLAGSALIVHCANRGAYVDPELLEHSLKKLWRSNEDEAHPVLAPAVITSLPEHLIVYLLEHQSLRMREHVWTTQSLDSLEAWLCHPTVLARPRLMASHLSDLPAREIWKTWDRLRGLPDAIASFRQIVLCLPDLFHVSLLRLPEASPDDLFHALKALGTHARHVAVHDLPGTPIPNEVWDRLPAESCLHALMQLYTYETPLATLTDSDPSPDTIDRAIITINIAHGDPELVARYQRARLRHDILQERGIDIHLWLHCRLQARFPHGHTSESRFQFICQLTQWMHEDLSARASIGLALFQYFELWVVQGKKVIDPAPRTLTLALIDSLPPFLEPMPPPLSRPPDAL